uniref:Fibronectin type III domain containing 1 n=1 Tax=Oryzias melastigma TaxID=30732 RepID=A0A3B3D7C2_ORYME
MLCVLTLNSRFPQTRNISLLLIFSTISAEKLPRSQNGKQTSLDEILREIWEPPIHLDGRPVDRFFTSSSSKPTRLHRFSKVSKDSRAHLLEDLDPDWVDLDGFAVLGNAPVRNSSAGSVRSSQTGVRNYSTAGRNAKVDRTARPAGGTSALIKRRAPQSSSGPRQPDRSASGAPMLHKRRQHNTKRQAEQINRYRTKPSESVHMVSLQAQTAQGLRAPPIRAAAVKSIPEPPINEARDINVRVMSPKSVLISWVDPAVEMGKVSPEASRSYTVRFREKGESARWEYRESSQRRVMIETLSADGMYEFSIRISEGEKHSEWSASVFQRTPESAPSGPPENFEVKPLRGKGTVVTATWDPPEEPNGRIREYILSYAPAMKPFGMKSLTYSGSTTTATIDGLTPGERYIFKIRATNKRGMGPQSKAFSVAMPKSSSGASSSSKTKHSQQTVDSEDKSSVRSTEVPPATTPQIRPAGRRLRPLSQTRSYHSIFSSIRGSVRHVSNRGKAKDDEVEDKITPTPPSTEETTTVTVVPETKKIDNNVDSVSEEKLEYDEEPKTTNPPSLKVLTPSPTKPVHRNAFRPNRRPVKIRVHQKSGSKIVSSSSNKDSSVKSLDSSSSAKSSSISLNSSSSLPSLSMSLSSSVSSSSSQIQNPEARREANVAATYPHSPNIYSKTNRTESKPSTAILNGANSQKINIRGSLAGRSSSSSGLGVRFGRKHPRLFVKGNSSQISQSYKPAAATRQSLNPQSTSKTESASPERADNQETQNTFNPKASQTTLKSSPDILAAIDSSVFDKSQLTIDSGLHGSTAIQDNKPSTSGSFLSTAQGVSPNSATLHILQGSQKSTNQDTTYREATHLTPDNDPNKAEVTKLEEPSFGSERQVIETGKRGDKSGNGKRVHSRTRLSPTFAERFPWLASRYPGRFDSKSRGSLPRQSSRAPLTRVSSSVGAGRPLLTGTPTRLSGAAGSSIQETKEDLRISPAQDTLSNTAGSSLVQSNQNVASDTRKPLISVSPSASDSDSHHFLSGKRPSSEHTNIKEKLENHLLVRSGEDGNDLAESYKDSTITSISERTANNRDNVGRREALSRTNPSLSSRVIQSPRRPGVGMTGNGRSSHLNTRQFGGSRLPIRPHAAQNSRLDASSPESVDFSSSNIPLPDLTSDRNVGGSATVTKTGGLMEDNSQTSSRDSSRNHGSRRRYPVIRGKPNGGNGRNGRLNLTASNEKDSLTSLGSSKIPSQKFITGPDGTKWMIDFERGFLMNQDGQVLQDSQGRPKRVVLGEDGRTIFDHMGSPLLNQEGLALFGHGRDSQPVVNPKNKLLMVGGKPVLGLDVFHPKSFSTITTTTARPTTQEPTTTEWSSEEFSTTLPFPTCPPGTFSKTDEFGYPLLDQEGILDCYPEEDASGMETDDLLSVSMVPDALALEKDELLVKTTSVPTTTRTTTETPTPEPNRPMNRGPSSAFDLSGKERFTAPYVNYIRKDPGAPCSLTEALEFLQVDVLADLMKKDHQAASQKEPPKHKPHNLTVVAMEGCHSFIILDWARPLKGDMVSGYMVYSASYDDVLKNKWSSRLSNGTHLPVENLKPNSRYYFKVQAKNVFGLGPVSETLTYVTESDDPLLIERPPGGEPIWIPFTFKYNPAHSSCKGSQYVKRTWYRKFVGVVLCNSLRYKIFMGDGLRDLFHSIGDTVGQGEDHCQFVDSYRDGRTGPISYHLPSAQGYYRAYRQEPVKFGAIGPRSPHSIVGWYECGVPIPGKW